MRVAVMSHNKALREGLYLQIARGRRHSRRSPGGQADAILIDAGTGNVPDLTVQPDPAVPALVLLTPNARGRLERCAPWALPAIWSSRCAKPRW